MALVQFIFVLDLTVVNVALPGIRDDLGFSEAGLVWVVDGYALMGGGLLLLGGRLSDLLGRRRVFLAGVGLFAVASFLCGAAQTPALLVASRFGQGIGEALAAPAALGIIVVIFTDPAERIKAVGIWVGLAAVGGTLGVVLSGVVNELTSWRWIFFINVPIAIFALVVVPRLVGRHRPRQQIVGRMDILGALTVTGGLVSLVYALLEAASRPWGSVHVVVPLVVGVLLLVSFVVVERLVSNPLVPLSFFANRTRMAACTASLLFAVAFFTMFFLLTLYMQGVLRWTPLETGLAYLPYGLFIVAGGGMATGLVPKVGVRPVLAAGCVLTAAGLLLLSATISPDSTFLALLPAMLLIGLGAGLTFPVVGNAALHQVSESNAGLASGVQSASYQIGGALGLAVLVTVSTRRQQGTLADGVTQPFAATAGYALAFQVGAAIVFFAAVLTVIVLQAGVGQQLTGRHSRREDYGAPGGDAKPETRTGHGRRTGR